MVSGGEIPAWQTAELTLAMGVSQYAFSATIDPNNGIVALDNITVNVGETCGLGKYYNPWILNLSDLLSSLKHLPNSNSTPL